MKHALTVITDQGAAGVLALHIRTSEYLHAFSLISTPRAAARQSPLHQHGHREAVGQASHRRASLGWDIDSLHYGTLVGHTVELHLKLTQVLHLKVTHLESQNMAHLVLVFLVLISFVSFVELCLKR
jgi:hypothetical protein